MESGSEILPYYDSMIVKIIVHEQNRELALQGVSDQGSQDKPGFFGENFKRTGFL